MGVLWCSPPGGRRQTYQGAARPNRPARRSALQLLLAATLLTSERFVVNGTAALQEAAGAYHLAASPPAVEQAPAQNSASSSLYEPSQRRRLTGATVKPLPTSKRCVFILATGRSGSTCLADALNQLPDYFIRGEQSASFYHLFNAYRRLNATWQHAFLMNERLQQDASGATHSVAQSAQNGSADPDVQHRPSYDYVKGSYNRLARNWKLPWFNDLHPDRVREAVRSMYTMLYGYHGNGVVSGFKEVRYGYYGKGLALRCSDHADGREVVYGEFTEFMRFMRSLCVDVKVLLNSRASPKAKHNVALKKMTARLKTDAAFEHALNRTHTWYDRYAAEHPDHAMRVVMEDMFNPQTQGPLAEALLRFLGEDPAAHRIKFDRMPAWSNQPHHYSLLGDEDRDGGSAISSSLDSKMSDRRRR